VSFAKAAPMPTAVGQPRRWKIAMSRPVSFGQKGHNYFGPPGPLSEVAFGSSQMPFSLG
jgi:hypothetical protein